MWVKICGTTCEEDARRAIESGADAVGFVFAESPRQVRAEQVAAMGLGSVWVQRVGVFAGQGVDEIVRVVAMAGLTGVQLHGGEADLDRLFAEVHDGLGGIPVVPVVHWDVAREDAGTEVAGMLERLRAAGARRVLLDVKSGDRLGGTGVSFDWARAADEIAEARGELELVLAGGLTAESVGEAVRALEPWGVDVVSGVEREPGRKDPLRVLAFVRAARACVL